jgi:hypothetical protein
VWVAMGAGRGCSLGGLKLEGGEACMQEMVWHPSLGVGGQLGHLVSKGGCWQGSVSGRQEVCCGCGWLWGLVGPVGRVNTRRG